MQVGDLTKGNIAMQVHAKVTLPKDITAIYLGTTEEGESRLACVSSIPEGAELRVCGRGFNTRSVEVNWNGHYYFVFLQDIEHPEGNDVH